MCVCTIWCTWDDRVGCPVHRQECKKLREELREGHEEDKRAALLQLAQMKEHELGTAREGWQRKVEDLLEQVTRARLNHHTAGIQSYGNTQSYCNTQSYKNAQSHGNTGSYGSTQSHSNTQSYENT